jgi:hypothetical protein
MKKWQKIGLTFGVIAVLVFVGWRFGFFNIFIDGGGSHKGPVYFYGEMKATDDATDLDGAGTLRFVTGSAPYQLLEPALTLGTDTHTTLEYRSGDTVWVDLRSTTANAMDHFSYRITFPFGDVAVGDLFELSWSEADENWILTLKGAQEAQPVITPRTIDGTDVGTTDYDLSDNDYTLEFNIHVTVGANYDGLFAWFDPLEGDGEWDSLYLIMTANVSAANAGWTVGGPWQVCSDGKSYYCKLDPYLGPGGILVRWDQEEEHCVILVPWSITSADVDTSGAGALLLTFNCQEANGDEQAFNQTWEGDAIDNQSAAATADTLTCSD